MSVAREHNEWLSLIETSGPFLSLPVLLRAFPQGLEARDADLARNLRSAYEEWDESRNGRGPDPATHTAWIRYVLQGVLELPADALAEGQDIPQALRAELREHRETLRPDLALLETDDPRRPRLLIQTFDPRQDLEKPVADRYWKASPATRMVELLHAADCRLGLVTNGERWMLVNAPRKETSGFASWHAHLWLEEPLTQRAFRSLLSVRRFFGVPEKETLEALLAASTDDQQKVTDQLGYQVRRAVETLIQELDRADQDRGRGLLADVSEELLYEAALSVMMRLVFLFCAEERQLLPIDEPLYAENYAVSTLHAQLREAADQYGEEVLERRFDAWHRLLALFRAVHGGISHDRLSLPAYGGHLFEPDRFPFLEGRPAGSHWRDARADPLPVDNRTVLHLLEALQFLEVKIAGGGQTEKRRLSFRALDIEQIGHVYETLLDHTAKRATEPVLSLKGAKNKEPEVSLRELEELREKGKAELVKFLRKPTGRSVSALTNAVSHPPELKPGPELDRLTAVCGNDRELLERVRPFAALIRLDWHERPVVILPGSVHVTDGASRRLTASHYTPRSLTEPIVRHTLDPVVYSGPAEGKPPEQWELRPPRELLDLKVCDMACGSGAFLVETCRYLAERLVEAWERIETAAKSRGEKPLLTPFGERSAGAPGESLIPSNPEERLVYARRIVAERCLYGVDKNPLAVEMAKLSLWLVTLDKGRPFTFLDHAVKHGDSLLGAASRGQMEKFHVAPGKADEAQRSFDFWERQVRAVLTLADEKRRELESFPVVTIEDSERKQALLAEAEKAASLVRTVCDLLAGAAIDAARRNPGKSAEAVLRAFEATRNQLATEYLTRYADPSTSSAEEAVRSLEPVARQLLDGGKPASEPSRRPFHWPLEFPEVFGDGGGFNAIVGNPPFMGGKKISGPLGKDFREYVVAFLADGRKGHADICAYFFLRAASLLRPSGGFGLLATNTIAQGDSREVALDHMTANGWSITRAVPSRKWPGVANLEVAHVWLRRDGWKGPYILDEQLVEGITAFLAKPGAVTGNPYRLAANAGKSFQGSIVLGMGFVLEPEEAQRLIEMNPRNRDVLFPYLNGEDLNSRPDQSPSRWVINFHDWPLNRGADGSWADADTKQRKQWLREGVVPKDYADPVASDYPDCLAVLSERVEPDRTRRTEDGTYKLRYPLYLRWWQYADKRPELYATIAGLERVLVTTQTTRYQWRSFVPNGWVYGHKLVVFGTADWGRYGVLDSSIHYWWVVQRGSSLKKDPVYTPSDCFATFPFPASEVSLSDVALRYHTRRAEVTAERQEGLTVVFQRFHNPEEASEDILSLRRLRTEMDQALATSYNWENLDLGHGFHETKQGLRYTISEAARRKVLDRLLALNHERYAEEVRQGLHEKKKKASASKKKTSRKKAAASPETTQLSLL